MQLDPEKLAELDRALAIEALMEYPEWSKFVEQLQTKMEAINNRVLTNCLEMRVYDWCRGNSSALLEITDDLYMWIEQVKRDNGYE